MGQYSKFQCSLILLVLAAFTSSVQAAPVKLFQISNKASFEWLLSDHEGSGPIKKGMACVECHDSESPLSKKELTLDLALGLNKGELEITFLADKKLKITSIALILDNEEVKAFTRTGCWASCHSDMKGMDHDAGQLKYLGASRMKVTRTGGGDATKPDAALLKLREAGDWLELMKVDGIQTSNNKVEQLSILDKPQQIAKSSLSLKSIESTADGKQKIVMIRASKGESVKEIVTGGSYTIGVAVHLSGESGHSHYVSLPISFKVTKNGVQL